MEKAGMYVRLFFKDSDVADDILCAEVGGRRAGNNTEAET